MHGRRIRSVRTEIVVTSLKRSPAVPELPTLDESGLPGHPFGGWDGIAVPAGLPREIATRLNAEANKALLSAQLLKTIAGGTPAQFCEHVRTETERLSKLIKAIGIKPH